jgi:hydroxymethylpyrimidine pyrophosphatase-like HAD family hydrolase
MTQQPKTWFVDFDGTLVTHSSHRSDTDTILNGTKLFFEEVVGELDHVIITTARSCEHRERIERFLKSHGIRFSLIICGLPSGARIVLNDKKPDGSITAYAYNLERDEGIINEIFPMILKSSELE